VRNKDQILLESLYERILENSSIPRIDGDFEEYKSPTQKDLDASYIKIGGEDDIYYDLNYLEDEDYDGTDISFYELKLKDGKNKKNIGYLTFKIDDDKIVINQILVFDEYRNKGYGQLMYRLLAKFGQKNGKSKIYTDTITPSAINARKKVFNLKMKKFGEHGLKAESDIDKNVNYSGFPTPRL
jgi:GNAT superfamily N-acetyltransferase